MNQNLKSDLENLASLLEAARQTAVDHLSSLNEKHTATKPRSPGAVLANVFPQGTESALKIFSEEWAPNLSASAGPRYLGFVTGGSTPAALVGDWLASVFDQNVMAGLDSDAPELERQTVRAIGEWIGLRNDWSGSFVSGATMSNVVGLAAAREWAGDQIGRRTSQEGIGSSKSVLILAASPHSSIYKAASILGLGRDCVRLIDKQPGREAVDVVALEAALKDLKGQPVIIVASAGTVNTGDFDDLQALAHLRDRYGCWLHVDAAFGAFAALDARVASRLIGLSAADSVCVDCHKWLNVPYDSALQFIRHREMQVRVFRNAAAYLGEADVNDHFTDFVHLTPENSRRWRALPAWFAVQAYGGGRSVRHSPEKY